MAATTMRSFVGVSPNGSRSGANPIASTPYRMMKAAFPAFSPLKDRIRIPVRRIPGLPSQALARKTDRNTATSKGT